MKKITRFGVSIETELLKKFDTLIKASGYKSRSEAFRDLIRDKMIKEEWRDQKKEVVGILGLVYNHDQRELTETLNKIQHHNVNNIVSSTHIHLDHHNCLEVIILKGKSKTIKILSDKLLSTRNVKGGKLLQTTTGSEIG